MQGEIATVTSPTRIVIDSQPKDLYITEQERHCIRKIDTEGIFVIVIVLILAICLIQTRYRFNVYRTHKRTRTR